MTAAIPTSLKILLGQIMDYAGLYPPASLPIPQAVRNYRAYLESDWAWMLGKFIVNAAQLEVLLEEKAQVSSHPWNLSVLVSSEDELERLPLIEGSGLARVASVEVKQDLFTSVGMTGWSPWRPIHVEGVAIDDFSSLKSANCHAKIRMGGVLESAFPNADDVLRFIESCVKLELPFKATAGLHHPLRGSYRLTYAQDSSRGTMYGYLNLLIATAFTLRNDFETARGVLLESDAEAFQFDDMGIRYDGQHLSLEDIRATRALLHSIGSCSFEEPTMELLKVIA